MGSVPKSVLFSYFHSISHGKVAQLFPRILSRSREDHRWGEAKPAQKMGTLWLFSLHFEEDINLVWCTHTSVLERWEDFCCVFEIKCTSFLIPT